MIGSGIRRLGALALAIFVSAAIAPSLATAYADETEGAPIFEGSEEGAGDSLSDSTTAPVDQAVGESEGAGEEELASAKSNYLSLINERFSAYHTGDYTEAGFEELTLAYEGGVATVKAAESIEQAEEAYEAALEAMEAVKKDDSSEIAAAKVEALLKLVQAYAGLSKPNYSDSAWKQVESEYDKAKKAVDSADSPAAAAKAASDGVKAMNAIKAGSSGSGSNSSSSGKIGLSNAGKLTSETGGGTTSSGSSGSSSGSAASGLTTSSGSSGLSSGGSSGLSASGSSSGLRSTSLNSGGTTSGLAASGGGSSGLAARSSTSATAASAADLLGVKLQAVTNELMEEKSLSADFGLYVDSVENGGPAGSAGIQTGDVITKVAGKDVTSVEEIDSALKGKASGDVIELTVERAGQVSTIRVTLGGSSTGGNATSGGAASGNSALAALAGRNDSSSGGSSSDSADGTGAENGDAGVPGGQSMGATPTGASADGLSQVSASQGVQISPVPVLVGAIVLAAGIAGLVLFLMKRRNAGLVDDEDLDFLEDGDEPESGDDELPLSGGLAPAIQF